MKKIHVIVYLGTTRAIDKCISYDSLKITNESFLFYLEEELIGSYPKASTILEKYVEKERPD